MRLCDEDTDLGLDYALPRIIARTEVGASVPRVHQQQDRSYPQPSSVSRRERVKSPPEAPGPTRRSETDREEPDRVDEGEHEEEDNVMIEQLVERAKTVADQASKAESADGDPESGPTVSHGQDQSSKVDLAKPVVPSTKTQPKNEANESARPKEPEAI